VDETWILPGPREAHARGQAPQVRDDARVWRNGGESQVAAFSNRGFYIMRFRITTRTQGAGGDPFLWVSDDFVMEGITVDEAIEKGRAAAIAKHPEAHIHLVYGAIPTDEALPESPKEFSKESKRSVRTIKGKGA
jgi:hypothetical protein